MIDDAELDRQSEARIAEIRRRYAERSRELLREFDLACERINADLVERLAAVDRKHGLAP